MGSSLDLRWSGDMIFSFAMLASASLSKVCGRAELPLSTVSPVPHVVGFTMSGIECEHSELISSEIAKTPTSLKISVVDIGT